MLLTFQVFYNRAMLLAAGLGRQWEGEGVHCPSLSPGGVSNYPGSQQSHMELHCSGVKDKSSKLVPR